MKSKKFFKSLIALACTMVMVAGCATQNQQQPVSNDTSNTSEDTSENSGGDAVAPVKIAAFYNISGSGADSGYFSELGAKLAAENINNAGGIKSLGGAQIEIVIGDTMTDTSQAKAVADRVLADKEIVAAIGFSGSAWAVPMLPSFEKNQIPVVLQSTANTITEQGYQFVFRHVPTSEAFGKQQVEFLKSLKDTYGVEITKVGALYENTENGISNTKGAKETAEAAGFEWVYEEAFPFGLSDASNLVVGMRQSGAQVIFLTALSQDAKIISNTMKSMNYSPITFGTGAGFLMPAFADELGDDVDGIISIGSMNWDTPTVENSPDLKDVAKQFEEKHGIFMAEHAVGAYNATYLIASALENSGSRDSVELRDALRALNIDSFTGKVEFTPEGENLAVTVPVVQWQKDPDGKYRPRSVFPDNLKVVDYQLPDGLKP